MEARRSYTVSDDKRNTTQKQCQPLVVRGKTLLSMEATWLLGIH